MGVHFKKHAVVMTTISELILCLTVCCIMQVWQWIRYRAILDDGKPLTRDRVAVVVQQELDALRRHVGTARFATGHYLEAGALVKEMITARELPDFLTLPAYELVLQEEFAGEEPSRSSKAMARL